MAEYTRILLRQGPDSLKNSVVLRSGEPAYVTDYERLVIGDGVTGGGVTIGSKFLGFVEFDPVSLEVFNVKPGYPGDLIFETSTNLLYVLSGNETVVGKKAYQIKTNYQAINKTPLPDSVSIIDRDGALSIADEGVDGRHIATYALGNGLQKNTFNPLIIEIKPPSDELQILDGRLQIADGGVTNRKLSDMGANTIKARLNQSGPPDDISIDALKRALGLITEGGGSSFGVPVGTIIDYAGNNAPANYMPCDGRELSQEEYIELYNAIGATWGQPTLTSFNIPNLNKRTTIGSGSPSGTGSTDNINESVGSYGGTQSIFLASRHLPAHSHKIDFTVPAHTHTFTLNLPQVGGGYDVGDIVTNGYNNYIVTIKGAGPDAAPQTIPPGPDANSLLRYEAYETIKGNKAYIQQRVIDYINFAYPYALSAFYTDSRGVTGLSLSAVCYRDSGYITDSIAADILNNANHRSVETGNLYFSGFVTQQRLNVSGRSVPSLPEDQFIPTVKAIEAIGSFIAGINIPPSPITKYNTAGVLSGSQFYNETQRVITSGLQNFTSTIANSGNIPVTTPSNNEYLEASYYTAASAIKHQKSEIQRRVVDYVIYNFPYALSGTNELNSEQLSGKCFRDTGYIIDSLVADILNDANHRSVETGLFYFSGAMLARQNAYNSNVPTLPQDQVFATIQAISSIGKFINGNTMPFERSYTTKGVLSSYQYFSTNQNKALSSLSNFESVIKTGQIPSTTPAGNTDGDNSYLSASNLILTYRSQLQQQVVEYVKYYFPEALSGVDVSESDALSAKCFRDTGYIIDSLAADILNNTNHRSVETGLFYFNGAVLNRFSNPDSPVPTLPTNQVNATIGAISALSFYINGDNIPVEPTPFTTTGILSSSTGGESRKNDVTNLVSIMHYPLRNNGQQVSFSPAGSATSEDTSLSQLLLSNRSNIQQAVSAYVFDKGYLMTPVNNSQYEMLSSYNNFITIISDSESVMPTSPSGDTSSADLSAAALIISSNRSNLQQSVVDFVIHNYEEALSGVTTNDSISLSGKCYRDTGYIIDSIVADILNNANHRSVETGVFYFSGAVLARSSNPESTIPTLPTNQVESTINAISALGAMIAGGTLSTPISTYNFPGILDTGSSQIQKVLGLTDVMVYPLRNNGQTYQYEPMGAPTQENINLGNLLLENRSSIQSLVSSYVLKKNYLTFNPATSAEITAKCNRDAGFMIDAVANDLITGVVAKSIQYAVAYWDGSTSRIPDSNIPNQRTNTLDVIEYLKKMSLYYANITNTLKCNRDVGYMIDAVASDLSTGVNARSIQYAVAYWDGNTSRIPDSNIPSQRANTLDVIEYLRSVMIELMIKGSNILNNRVIKKVESLVNTMIYPLENNGNVLPYVPGGVTDSSKVEIADRLIQNKEAIQNAVTNYVVFRNYLIAGSDLLAKCKRDVGFMVDAIANDLKTGVNAKSVQYALSYWDGSASRLREIPNTEISNQRNNTIDTIFYLQSVMLDYTRTQNEKSILTEVMDLTKDMVYPLYNEGALPPYIPAGAPITPSRQTAIDILLANKTDIQKSTRDYVRSLNIIAGNTEPFLTLQEKCNRDVGYMIDSIVNDLKTGVNARSIQYALSYWDGNKNRIGGTPGYSPNQIDATIATLKFLRDLSNSTLVKNGIGVTGDIRYTDKTLLEPVSAAGQYIYDGFTGSGNDQLFNDPVPNIQPSAVVSKCIKFR